MPIKTPFGVRLWLLIATLLLVGGGTIYGLFSSWHRVREIEARLTTSQIERFELANGFRRELQTLNASLLRYALLRNPEEWKLFENTSSNLDRWIDENDPSLNKRSIVNTEAERQAFRELNSAYDDYVASARTVHSKALPPLLIPEQVAQLDAFEAQAERMRHLIRDLSNAHRQAEEVFIANATASLEKLRLILVAGVVLLLALVAAMGWVVYRDMIGPLRTKLVISQRILERQEKLATLGTLAAGIAHEIRNPLTSLKARLYTLEKHLLTVPAARKDTDIISAEISRLERIVSDILSFARPSEPHLETIDAQTLVGEIQGLMSPNLEKKGIRLAVESTAGLCVRADSGHLKQVLINLVRNAAEAIEGEGTVTLGARAGRARLGGHETESVVLAVTDTGKGIPPEVERRLFDPFFTTKETGAGLGLSIAARIVEKHGGFIRYQTKPGQGTTFGVVLPRESKESVGSGKSGENPAD